MAKLTDLYIRNLIAAGERFSGLSDDRCKGLYLCWPKNYAGPFWRFRYSVGGQAKALGLGSFGSLGLADARKQARELQAMLTLGRDPVLEKRELKEANAAKEEARRNMRTVAELAGEFLARQVDGKLKRPAMVRQRVEKHISQSPIGGMPVDQVAPLHIDGLLQGIVQRGHKRLANDVLGWLKRIFDYAVVRHFVAHNPAAAFRAGDAGGKAVARERALGLDEVAALLAAMGEARRFAPENGMAVRLLLLLGVRKMELLGARWEEFDLDAGVWTLPAARSKTAAAIRIPLCPSAVSLLRPLRALAGTSRFVFPRRAGKGDWHMGESTLNVALYGVEAGIEPFTVHDLRRTVRTQLGALRIPPHICERCLNHRVGGVEGVYDRYDYFEERREALGAWANVLAGLESGGKVVPIGRAKAGA